MDLKDVKLQMLNIDQIRGVSGAFAEELANTYIAAFKKQVGHLKTDSEFREMAPSQAMYTSLVHLMAKTIFGEIMTRSNYTGETAVEILNENLKMLFKDLTQHLDSLAAEYIVASNFEKDDGNGKSSN